ncbi:MAG: hypothetical protein V7776_15370 [Halopseudomonas aestusnigri]
MLSEAFTYVFAKCQNKFKRLGYLHEAIAIDSRRRRCRSAWTDHLQNSQKAIIKAVEKAENRNRIVILGAGAGYDVPLEFLLTKFKEIHLVDVVFLRPILKLAKTHSQITLVEIDTTGVINQLPGGKKGPIIISQLSPAPPREVLTGADLVISCNLMSQLPINIKNKLVTLGAVEDSKEVELFCRSILTSHLSWLEDCDAPVLLLADLEQHFVPKNQMNEKPIKENALLGVVFDNVDQSWLWNIAPCPEVDKDYSLKHLVGSFYLQKNEKFIVKYLL